jgi:hypothetical protein
MSIRLGAAAAVLVLASCQPPEKPPEPPTPPQPTAGETPPPAPAEPPLPEWAPGENMREALSAIVTAANIVNSTHIYGFDDESICVVGAFLMPHQKVDISRVFTAGGDYVLIGGGTRLATDVDLAVSNEQNQILKQDTLEDVTPIVHFKPAVSGKYKITLVLQGARTGAGSFVAAAVMKVGGSNLGADRLEASLGGMLHRGRVAAAVAKKHGKDLYFHVGHPNGWALYSAVLKPQDVMRYTAIRPDTGQLIVIGGGDQAADDIDLGIAQGNTVLAKDTDRDANPVVVMAADPGSTYDVLVEDAASRGESLVTTIILEPDK